MRRLFSLFIVLLLVFRGLLGDAMAMGNVAPPAGPAHSAGASQDIAGAGHVHGSSASHGAHAESPAPGESCAAQNAGGCEHAHGASCAACGICHSALSPSAFLVRVPAVAAGIRPAGLSPRFVSALPLQAVKPPIS